MNAFSKIKSSLSLKLIAPIICIGFLILLGFSVFFVHFAKAVIDQQASEKGKDIVEALIIAIEADSDKSSAQRVVSALASRKNIVRLSLVEAASNKIIADNLQEYINQNLNSSYSPSNIKLFKELEKQNEITAAITRNTLYYQRVKVSLINPNINRSRPYYIYLIYDEYNEILHYGKYLLTLMSIFFIGILALAAGVYYVQRRLLTLPLTAINKAIESHDTAVKSQPIIHQSTDELGRLVTSYNTLITELENHAHHLELEKEKAEEATKAKSEFLACMSHEIRTPINGVLGMLKLLEATKLNRDQQHKTHLIRASSESLLSIINDILDFSKIEAGKLTLNPIEFNLLDELSTFTEAVAYKAQENNIDLILDVWRIKHIHLVGDSNKFRQILSNLVGNAIKFTNQGEIIISGETQKRPNGNIAASFFVSDTGIGIPEKKIPILFDAFTQADSSTTREFGGTGLGLAITKNLCQLMNGDIQVNSVKGKGSCFTFELIFDPQEKEISSANKQTITNNNMLVANKNPSSASAICNLVESWGAKAEAILSDKEFFDFIHKPIHKNKFDILILDYDFFQTQTFGSIRRLRKNLSPTNIKIILIAEIKQIEKFEHLDTLAIGSIFEKPITPNRLINAISQANSKQHFKHIEASTKEEGTKEKSTKETNSEETALSHKEPRILLVEDNHINQEVMLGLLEEVALKVDIANNGKEAIEILLNTQQTNYDLILMDCQMPVMDGYETTAEIRNAPNLARFNKTPIIALTANAMSGDREKCIKAGMNDYLSKPIAPEKLFKTIEFWSNKSSDTSDSTFADPVNLTADGSPVWDKNSVLRRIGNKEARLKKLVEKFIAGMPSLFDDLEDSIKNGDTKNIALHAHGIKGVSGNLSAMALMDISKQLELAAKNDDIEEVKLHWSQLNTAAQQLEAELSKYVGY